METNLITSSGALFGNIEFFPLTINALAGLLVLVILLMLSGWISGSETAFFSLEPGDTDSLKHNKKRPSQLILKLLSDPGQLLASILAGKTFLNIAFVLLAARVTDSLISFGDAGTFELIFRVAVILLCILLFGEIIPKAYAARHPLSYALKCAPFIDFLGKMTRPVSSMLTGSNSYVTRRMQMHMRARSFGQISKALKNSAHEDLTDDQEILEGIVKFGSKSVSEIMRSRLDMVVVDFKSNFSEVMEIIRVSDYSRIPVFSGTLDQVRGILYIKDLLPHISKGISFKWQQLIRPPFFIPETKKIDDLLEEFQKAKVHLAIVVDEFGGTSGLVTMEDILEEIVGDIADEFDIEEKFYTQLGPGEYLFDGKTLLNDFYKIVECDDHIFEDVKGEADTLAGLILELTGEFPEPHEIVPCKNFTFQIEAIDRRRIREIKVLINGKTDKK
ncbi:MAG TPA: gliding motility-associated protein GldE [Prolixibacteraceae bacterium]|nr:gliding motility-associated protein GldE [Prolixibacteraceae bacterium]